MRLVDDAEAPRRHQAAMATDREAAIPGALAAVAGDPEAHGQLAAALAAAPVFLAGRERTKTNIIRLVNEMRVGQRALGQPDGRARPAGPSPPAGRCSTTARSTSSRRSRPWVGHDPRARGAVRAAFELEPPFVFEGVGAAAAHLGPSATPPHRSGHAGHGPDRHPRLSRQRHRAGPRGPRPRRPRDLEPGDVLVAPITDPAWTPLFVPACAVVVDVGAQLSHAVIVSRELGIPCAVSVTGATSLIPDGALVTVDGTTGTVTVH